MAWGGPSGFIFPSQSDSRLVMTSLIQYDDKIFFIFIFFFRLLSPASLSLYMSLKLYVPTQSSFAFTRSCLLHLRFYTNDVGFVYSNMEMLFFSQSPRSSRTRRVYVNETGMRRRDKSGATSLTEKKKGKLMDAIMQQVDTITCVGMCASKFT